MKLTHFKQMKKYLLIFLIIIIIFGVFLRVYSLDSQFLVVDEHTVLVGSMKFAHSGFRDAFSYVPENPAFGRMILSVPSFFIDADYRDLSLIKPLYFIYSYVVYDAISKNLVPMRLFSAFLGILSLLFIYLISKELFGKKAAFWSLVVSAISFDLITYNRILYLQVFVIFFSLGTIFFFLKYIKSKLKIRYFYFLLTCLFLFFAIGSHHIQPWFLIPVLIISQFIFNKNIKDNIVISLIYLFVFELVWIIYSFGSDFSVTKMIAFTYGSSTSFLNIVLEYLSSTTHHHIVFGFLLRNNYVLGLVSLICIFMFFKLLYRKKLIGLVRSLIVKKDLRLVILLLFVVGFVGLGFTVLGDEMRQLMFLFIPLYIYSGAVIENIVKKRFVLGFVILLILVSCVQGVLNFPSSTINYSNFGNVRYQTMYYDDSVDKEVIDYLRGLGNPAIISNHINTLIFYSGAKVHIIPPGTDCNPGFFIKLKDYGYYILYNGKVDEDDNIVFERKDGFANLYFCELFELVELKKIHKFDDNIVLYKIV